MEVESPAHTFYGHGAIEPHVALGIMYLRRFFPRRNYLIVNPTQRLRFRELDATNLTLGAHRDHPTCF